MSPAQPAPDTPVEQTQLTEAPRTPAIEQRRNPGRIAAGALVIALSGVAAAFLWQSSGTTEQVLVVQRDVNAGQQLAAGDVVTQQITAGEGRADVITREELEQVAGQWVVSDVPAGTILTGAMITDTPEPKGGFSLVSVPIQPSRLPITDLNSGQDVRLVVGITNTQAGNTQTTGLSLTPGQSWEARVANVGALNDDGTRTVGLILPSSDASDVAAVAVSDAVTLVVDSPESGSGQADPPEESTGPSTEPSASPSGSPESTEPSASPSQSTSPSSQGE